MSHLRTKASFLAVPNDDFSEEIQGWEGGAIASIVLILLAIGLATLYSASNFLALQGGHSGHVFLVRQLQGAMLGGLLLVFISQIDYHRWYRLAWPFLGIVLAMLIIVLLPGTESLAPRINGARRWLNLGFMTIQPSELAKLALVVWTARTLVKKKDDLRSFRYGLLPILIVWGAVVVPIALEPSMSAAGICLVLSMIVALCGPTRILHFLALAVTGAIPIWIAIASAPYRLRRITAFLNPLDDPTGSSYQIIQSLTAIGSGGLFGRGFGQSQMKTGFLPEPHNDFASSVLAEEWGFLGLATLVLLYLLIAMIGLRIARRAPDLLGYLLGIGCTAVLVIPAFLHIAINLSLLPPTGVPLPFISYGRSSLLVSFAATGILLNIAAAGCRYREISRHLHHGG